MSSFGAQGQSRSRGSSATPDENRRLKRMGPGCTGFSARTAMVAFYTVKRIENSAWWPRGAGEAEEYYKDGGAGRICGPVFMLRLSTAFPRH